MTCLAKHVDSSSSTPGKFEWRLDGEIVDSSNEPDEVEDDEFEHTFAYEPTIADDKKTLTCRFTWLLSL